MVRFYGAFRTYLWFLYKMVSTHLTEKMIKTGGR